VRPTQCSGHLSLTNGPRDLGSHMSS
jgi:hypothetical protein